MCMKLIGLSQKIPRWALSTKTVYKVMYKSSTDHTSCYSAHRKYPYEIGVEQLSPISKDTAGDITYGLHAFPHLSDAITELNRMRRKEFKSNGLSEYAIYECHIPRGAKYYKGIWEYHWPVEEIANIVSNRMTIVKELIFKEDIVKRKILEEKQLKEEENFYKKINDTLVNVLQDYSYKVNSERKINVD